MAKTEQGRQSGSCRVIGRCLQRVIAATDGMEVIVLDDCSDDTTADSFGKGPYEI